jgi:hypothetical protein
MSGGAGGRYIACAGPAGACTVVPQAVASEYARLSLWPVAIGVRYELGGRAAGSFRQQWLSDQAHGAQSAGPLACGIDVIFSTLL